MLKKYYSNICIGLSSHETIPLSKHFSVNKGHLCCALTFYKVCICNFLPITYKYSLKLRVGLILCYAFNVLGFQCMNSSFQSAVNTFSFHAENLGSIPGENIVEQSSIVY